MKRRIKHLILGENIATKYAMEDYIDMSGEPEPVPATPVVFLYWRLLETLSGGAGMLSGLWRSRLLEIRC